MKLLQLTFLIGFLLFFSCDFSEPNLGTEVQSNNNLKSKQYITVLGIAQDAGYPQINCEKKCCNAYFEGNESKKLVSCLGLVDLQTNKKWLFDATPDIKEQTQILKENHLDNNQIIDGIFLTHAHIGHYTGLMSLGREALGANNIPVFAMPRMQYYLENNGPWSQLVKLNNIDIRSLKNDSTVKLSSALKVTPYLVPHRDEYSETVGYKIVGNDKSALFIPDIDKWENWQNDIIEEVKKVDYAFLDASFFRDGELDRDMSEIPHPFTTQTTTLFENEPLLVKNKIYFIHFNHTNPTILDNHSLKDSIKNLGFRFAKQSAIYEL